MASRKQHPAELRERAVAMVFELRAELGYSRGTLASVGHKLGINPETLRNWVEKAEVDKGQRPGTTSDDRKRIADLEREVRRDPAPDVRGVLVTLTDEGARTFDALAPEHLANEARLVTALDPRQQSILAALLQSLLVEFEPGVEDRPDERLGLVIAPAHIGLQRRAAVGLPPRTGLLVETARPGGPAAAAGIHAGDLLLRTPVRELRSLTCLARAIDGIQTVTIDVDRGNAAMTVTVNIPPA